MAESEQTNQSETGAFTGHNAMLHLLRRQIVTGQFPPNSRLPTRKQLLDTHGVSPVTLQRALDRLGQEGFVRSVDRVGSFVAARPPHLYRFPFIFPNSPRSGGEFSRFWQLIASAAPNLADRTAMQLPVYYNIDGHADNEDYQLLVRDVELGRVAGFIFPGRPWLLKETPLLMTPNLPRVAITRDAGDMHVVTPDFGSFFDRAAQHLAQVGRTRVAMLVRPNQLEDFRIDPDALLRRHGLRTRPEWIQVVGVNDSARSILHLLMSPNNTQRPDALIIGDDNWIDHATAGLIAAGVRVPQDMDVVTHCNFPQQEPRVMPFKRLGWDVRDLLSACLEVLAEQQEQKNPPRQRIMPAVFDHELESEF